MRIAIIGIGRKHLLAILHNRARAFGVDLHFEHNVGVDLADVNSVPAAGRADFVAMARPHLVEPYWTLHAAAAADYGEVTVPRPCLGGQQPLTRNLKRAAEMEAALRA